MFLELGHLFAVFGAVFDALRDLGFERLYLKIERVYRTLGRTLLFHETGQFGLGFDLFVIKLFDLEQSRLLRLAYLVGHRVEHRLKNRQPPLRHALASVFTLVLEPGDQLFKVGDRPRRDLERLAAENRRSRLCGLQIGRLKVYALPLNLHALHFLRYAFNSHSRSSFLP